MELNVNIYIGSSESRFEKKYRHVKLRARLQLIRYVQLLLMKIIVRTRDCALLCVCVSAQLPLEQVQNYLEQLLQQELLQPEYKKWSDYNVKKWSVSSPPATGGTTSDTPPSHMVSYNLGDAPYSPSSSVESLYVEVLKDGKTSSKQK